MIIRKFDEGFSRRMFLERTAAGVAAAGVLTPLWPQIARGDTSKVWPDELTSVEMYTKGKVKTGDVVSYSEVAAGVGAPRAVRAAASACAANRLAVLIPCHRALRADGGLGGYRWGLERKRALLAAERAA